VTSRMSTRERHVQMRKPIRTAQYSGRHPVGHELGKERRPKAMRTHLGAKRREREERGKRTGPKFTHYRPRWMFFANGPKPHYDLMRVDCMHTVPVQKSNGSLVRDWDNRLRAALPRLDSMASAG